MSVLVWVGFVGLVVVFLALDLGVFHRRAHIVAVREALGWTVVWIVMAMLFTVVVYFLYDQHWLGVGQDVGHELGGRQAAIQFLTGYIIEKSLSLDNVFVIALIFSYFGIPGKYQHRVLFWGKARPDRRVDPRDRCADRSARPVCGFPFGYDRLLAGEPAYL